MRARQRLSSILNTDAIREPLVVWADEDQHVFVTEADVAFCDEQPDPVPEDALVHVARMAARIPRPARLAADIRDEFLPGVNLDCFAAALKAEPSWASIPLGDGSLPLCFPRTLFISHVLAHLSRWACSTVEIAPEVFAHHVVRRLLPSTLKSAVPCPSTVLDFLKETGLAEERDGDWCLERVRAFGTLCRRLEVEMGFRVAWTDYPRCEASPSARCPLTDDSVLFWTGLDDRERVILRGRWIERKTLDQMAAVVGLSKQRVGQIEATATEWCNGAGRRYMNASLARALSTLPSCRLVCPDALADAWQADLGVRPDLHVLSDLLRNRYDIAPVALCGDTMWWLSWDGGSVPSDEVTWCWEDVGDPEAAMPDQPVALTTWEQDALRAAALRHEQRIVDESPRTMRDCVAAVLRQLGRPARLSEIRRLVEDAFTDRSAASQHVYNVLNKHDDTFIRLDQGVYALVGMEALSIPDEDGPPRGRPRTSDDLPDSVSIAPVTESVDIPTSGARSDICSTSGARLFEYLSPDGGAPVLAGVAVTVTTELSRLPSPRSLCDLRLSEEDYQWLRAWAASLHRRELRTWLNGAYRRFDVGDGLRLSWQEAIGIVLFLVSTETARREAREGNLWSAVAPAFAEGVRSLLFAQGQPTQDHKDALQAAARCLGLRHVFGQEGTQEYYITVFLQFGFTRLALKKMPVWLSGYQVSETVQYLSERGLASSSFQDLWTSLCHFRRGNITEKQAHDVLSKSPWVLPEWTSELLHHARQRPELDQARRAAGEGGEAPLLLDEPRLVWPHGGAPGFVVNVAFLAAMDLSAPSYALSLGPGVETAFLLRQPDETYSAPERIQMPVLPAHRTATLVDGDGELAAVVEREMWDPNEDVAMFELPSGRPIDAWRDPVSPRKAYALLATSDLEVSPLPTEWRAFGVTHRLYRLDAGWPESLHVSLDGELLWTPNVTRARRERPAPPDWSYISFAPGQREIRIGAETPVTSIRLPEGVRLEWARLGAEPLTFLSSPDGGVSLDTFTLSPERAVSGLNVSFGLRRGNRRSTVTRALPVRPVGALHRSGDGVAALSPGQPLSTNTAAHDAFQVFLPSALAGPRADDLSLLEGAAFRRLGVCTTGASLRGASRSRRWEGLAGYGASLVVRYPYNSSGVEESLRVADAVIDPGIVEAAEPGDASMALHLFRDIEPGPAHRVVHWTPGIAPLTVTGDDLRWDGKVWRTEVAVPDSFVAVAVAYRGERLGAWWSAQGWGDALADINDATALETAAMLRWMRLPLISPTFLPAVRRFALQHPGAALSAWLFDEGLPEGWVMPPVREEWLGVVRQVFSGWQPTIEEAGAVLALWDEKDGSLEDAVAGLLRVDPRLMAAVMSVAGGIDLAGEADRQQRLLADLPEDAPSGALRQSREDLLEMVASTMGVDSRFLERGIVERVLSGGVLGDTDAANLDVALGVEPFRRYLALCLLNRLA